MSVKAKVLVSTGPTASGKSLLAEGLASKFPLELDCVDSAAVYQGMDIGTAKPTLTTRQQIPYHLIDIREAGIKILQPAAPLNIFLDSPPHIYRSFVADI